MVRFLLTNMSTALATVRALFRSRSEQAIVELALRQQIATYAHQQRKPSLPPLDRAFRVDVSRIWPRWKEGPLHRSARDSGAPASQKIPALLAIHFEALRGRPPISAEVQAFIRRLATENGWRARKIQAERAKLGISVGLTTVSLSKRPDPVSELAPRH